MNEELRAELLERAHRDQAARNSLPPRGSHEEWQAIVAPVDEANTAWLRCGRSGTRKASTPAAPPWAWNPNARTVPASSPGTATPAPSRARTPAMAADCVDDLSWRLGVVARIIFDT